MGHPEISAGWCMKGSQRLKGVCVGGGLKGAIFTGILVRKHAKPVVGEDGPVCINSVDAE
jgi:hypothetical protein